MFRAASSVTINRLRGLPKNDGRRMKLRQFFYFNRGECLS
jgi:hypothetical protein